MKAVETRMTAPLDTCLNISLAHASLTLKLDELLGTLHGLGYQDFLLLTLLSRAEGGRMPVAELVRPMGMGLSAVTRQLVLLEKTGLAQRDPGPGPDGRRQAVLRPGGRKLLHGAALTAARVCAALVESLDGASVPGTNDTLRRICGSALLDR